MTSVRFTVSSLVSYENKNLVILLFSRKIPKRTGEASTINIRQALLKTGKWLNSLLRRGNTQKTKRTNK